MRRPIRVGLTGSIGMGKSTTARMLAARGYPVWDADAVVHRLYAPGGAGAQALHALVPEAVSHTDGVDRDALKRLISEDWALLPRIEAIVHPLVAQDRARFVEGAEADALVFDIPLLFETGADAEMDLTIVVSTDAATQRARVLARPGMTPAQYETMLAKQMPDAEKRKRADLIVRSDTPETAGEDVDRVVETLNRMTEESGARDRS